MALKKEDFQPLVHQRFEVVAGELTLDCELVECRSLGTPPVGDGEREGFALLFEGPREPPLAQGIYDVRHPALDAGGIFLVPVQRTEAGVAYEAVFN